jgi:hypothetical protein
MLTVCYLSYLVTIQESVNRISEEHCTVENYEKIANTRVSINWDLTRNSIFDDDTITTIDNYE